MRSHFCLLGVVFLALSAAAMADESGPSNMAPAPPADADQRLSQLEAETQALRAEVQRMRQQQAVPVSQISVSPAALPPPPETTETPGAALAEPQANPPCPTMEEIQGEMKKFAWKKGDFSITPYGFLWGNMVYATERTNPGSYTLFVQSASTQPESECIVDARNTRLGLDVIGPQIACLNCAQSGGKVEIDFQNSPILNSVGAPNTENRGTVLLRHAYAEVKNDQFRLLAGQTWDVVSPLYPGMLMYSVGWDGGNIGYRRAQFRGERYLAFSDTSLVTAQLSVNQTVFEDATLTIRGEAPSWPILEGRIAWTIGHRGKDDLPITVGVSGHIGEEQADITGVGTNRNSRTWSGNVDFRMPITCQLGIQAECFTGENLGAFLGGIGQGTNPVTINPIRSSGGWFEIWYDWTPCFHSHVGYSVDDPVDSDVAFTGGKTYNQFFFGNLVYDLTKSFLVGLEVSSWKTVYFNQEPGNSVRTEFVAKYGF